MSNSLEPQNQPSLVRFTSTLGSLALGLQAVDLAADDVREHGLVADVRARCRSLPRVNMRRALARRVRLIAQRRQPLQPGQVVGQGHVLAEHHQVHLVVAAQRVFPRGQMQRPS